MLCFCLPSQGLIFGCVAYVCKWAQRTLAADLPRALRLTSALRGSRSEHVRSFAADAVAFLYRVASNDALAVGVRALTEETRAAAEAGCAGGKGEAAAAAATRHAAAALLARALRGTGSACHSRAPQLLGLLMPPRPPSPGEPAAAGAAVRRALAEATLAALLPRLRRGGCGALWDAMLACASGAGEAVTAAAAAGGPPPSSEALLELTHALQLLALAAEFHRGSRVESYAPLVGAVEQFLAVTSLWLPRASPQAGPCAAALLRLAAALLAGHAATAGASCGPAAGEAMAQRWAALLPAARLPFAALAPFARQLSADAADAAAVPPGARLALAPALCGALAPAAVRSRADNGACAQAAADLCDVCDPRAERALLAPTPQWRLAPRLALRCWLDGARGEGAGGFGCTREGAAAAAAAAPQAWLHLRLLPHCCGGLADALEAAQLAADVADTAGACAARLARGGHHAADEAPLDVAASAAAAELVAAAQRLTALQGAALVGCLRCVRAHAPGALAECAALALRHVAERPASAPLLRCAADALDCARDAPRGCEAASLGWGGALDLSTQALLRDWLPLLEPALAVRSSLVRHGALRVLAHFWQPPLLPLPSGAAAAPQPPQPSPVLFDWRELSQPLEQSGGALVLGRRCATLLGAQARLLRAGRVPPPILTAACRCALGGLRTRFAALWPHCQEVLNAALEAQPAAAFPLILASLAAAQRECLEPTPPPAAAGAQSRGGAPAEAGAAGACGWDAALEGSFSQSLLHGGSSVEPDDCTDGATLHGLLLRGLAKAPGVLGERGCGVQLAPLLLLYAQPVAATGELRGGARHRRGLRDWLALLKALGGPRACGALAAPLRTLLQETLLSHGDAAVQTAALACLRAGKEGREAAHLALYGERLERVVAPKTMRSEMAAWPLAPGAGGLSPEHRAATLPLLLAVLFPKLRARRGRAARGAPAAGRTAVLSYLSALEPAELSPLMRRFLAPFAAALGGGAGGAPWDGALGRPDGGLLARVDAAALAAVPLRRRVGFLHIVADVLSHLGDHATAFWDPLVALSCALLDGTLAEAHAENRAAAAAAAAAAAPCDAEGEDAAAAPEEEEEEEGEGAEPSAPSVPSPFPALFPAPAPEDEDGVESDEEDCVVAATSADEAREVRGLALRVLASALRRHPSAALWAPYWPSLARASRVLAPRLAREAAGSVGVAPPLLELACSCAGAPELALHLADDAELLPAVLGCLGAPRASAASRAAAVGVLEGVLQAGPPGAALLRAHAPTLLAALRDVLLRCGCAAAAASRELALLVRLAPALAGDGADAAADGGAAAAALVAALLPALGAGGAKKGGRGPPDGPATRVLAALAALWPTAASASASPLLLAAAPAAAAALAPLFGSLRGGAARGALVRCLGALAPHHPPSAAALPLLLELNSAPEERMEGLDVGRQLGAYGSLSCGGAASVWAGLLAARAAPPLLHHCLSDLRCDDMALRHAAGGALEAFLSDAAAADETLRGVPGAGPLTTAVSQPQADTPAALVVALVLPCVRAGLRSPELACRREHAQLLAAVVQRCPGALPSLALLRKGDDPEADIWYNLTHVQMHRRVRALRRLAAAVALGSPGGAAAAAAYVAPLCEGALGEAGAGGAPELGEAAVEALAGCARALAWPDYSQLLRRRLLAAAARPEGAKLETRAAAAILGAFHCWEEEGVENTPPEEGCTRVAPPKVCAHIQRTFLPLLSALVTVGDGLPGAGGVRPSAALAACRALKLLPPAAAAAAAPTLLGGAAAGLRSRAAGVRDGARAALAQAAAELGPQALPYLADICASQLRQGFQKHVLGYTVHAMLSACATAHASAPPAAFGAAAQALAPLLEEDIFGSVADEKDGAPGIASAWKEARRCRSYESLELLACRSPFPEAAGALMGCVTARLGGCDAAGVRVRCENALGALARGFARNAAAPQHALLAFVHATLDDGLAAEKRAAAWRHTAGAGVALGERVSTRHAGAAAATEDDEEDDDPSGMAVDGQGDGDESDGDDAPSVPDNDDEDAGQPPPHFELLTSFALAILRLYLKAGSGGRGVPAASPAQADQADADLDDDEDDERAAAAPPARRALLEGMVGVLVKSVRSRHSGTCEGALRCLTSLAPLKLHQLTAASPALAKRLHALLRRVGARASHPLSGCALRLWGALLRCSSTLSPTPAQASLLYAAAACDLDSPASCGASFALLRALLARQPLPAEAHALLAGSVRSLLVRAHSQPVRAHAQRTFLQYLLAAPLGPRRFAGHLEFLVANLGYAHPDGRTACLGAIAALVARLPQEVLEEHASYLLLPLVARLVGDCVPAVRAASGQVLSQLLARVSHAQQDAAVAAAMTWLRGEDARLRRAAAQLLGLAVEAAPAAVARAWGAHLAPALAAALARAERADADASAVAVAGGCGGGGGGGAEEGEACFEVDERDGTAALPRVVAPGWQEAYYCCTLLEKAWRSVAVKPLLGAAGADEPLWAAAGLRLALHRHAWVRAAAARLLGLYCARCGADGTRADAPDGGALAGAGLGRAARSQAAALASAGLNQASQAQVVKNLVFLTAAAMLRAHAAPPEVAPPLQVAPPDDGDGEQEELEDEQAGGDARFARWLLRRVCACGAPGTPESARLAVLRWSAGVASRAAPALSGDADAAQQLLGVAYRATEGASENTPEGVKALGEEVIAHLRATLPPAAFAAAYAAVRSAAAARRLKRKSERALEAVVDAGAAQRRRNARADKKKESRLALSAERKAHKARGTLPPELAERRAAKKQRRGGAVA